MLLLLLLGGRIRDRVHNATPSISARHNCLHVCYFKYKVKYVTDTQKLHLAEWCTKHDCQVQNNNAIHTPCIDYCINFCLLHRSSWNILLKTFYNELINFAYNWISSLAPQVLKVNSMQINFESSWDICRQNLWSQIGVGGGGGRYLIEIIQVIRRLLWYGLQLKFILFPLINKIVYRYWYNELISKTW